MTARPQAKVPRTHAPHQSLTAVRDDAFRARVMGSRAERTVMPKHHRRKAANRARAKATGGPYAAAASGSLHTHPVPDLPDLTALPYSADRPVDEGLAARLIAAAQAACEPCQRRLGDAVVADRATLAVMAGHWYGVLPSVGIMASDPTRSWAPAAREAARSGSGEGALADLDAMSADQARQVLEDALDHWAMHNLTPAVLREALDRIEFTGLNLHLAEPEPAYEFLISVIEPPQGARHLVMFALPETLGADAEHFAAATGWPVWDPDAWPQADPQWRLEVDAAARTLQAIVHTDPDRAPLWEAAADVSLPDEAWNLVRATGHVLVVGALEDVDVATISSEEVHRIAATGQLRAAAVPVVYDA